MIATIGVSIILSMPTAHTYARGVVDVTGWGQGSVQSCERLNMHHARCVILVGTDDDNVTGPIDVIRSPRTGRYRVTGTWWLGWQGAEPVVPS